MTAFSFESLIPMIATAAAEHTAAVFSVYFLNMFCADQAGKLLYFALLLLRSHGHQFYAVCLHFCLRIRSLDGDACASPPMS